MAADNETKPFPDGHFYSPVVSVADAQRAAARIWPARPSVPGIDFNDAGHAQWLQEILPQYRDGLRNLMTGWRQILLHRQQAERSAVRS